MSLRARIALFVLPIAAALGLALAGAASQKRLPTPPAAERCAARPIRAPESSALGDPSFGVASWDAGRVARACVARAPWGAGSWGVEASSFRDEQGAEARDRRIDRAGLAVAGGEGRLAAQDLGGRWAFARFLQGDVWGGSSCGGAVPWRRLAPIPVADPGLRLDFDVCLEESELGSVVGSWILVGANVWVSSPSMPKAGPDRFGRKPLVLDLMVHHRTSMLGIRDGSHEDAAAYHHQVAVDDVPAGRWSHVAIDLAAELHAAARRFDLERAWDDLAIHQVELVVEVHDARAAARVDDVVLRTRSRDDSRRQVTSR